MHNGGGHPGGTIPSVAEARLGSRAPSTAMAILGKGAAQRRLSRARQVAVGDWTLHGDKDVGAL
jgi:hypothetical protein